MAMFNMIHVHDCTRITARSGAGELTTWLDIDFGDCSATVFMPTERAQRLAAAINAADAPVAAVEAARIAAQAAE